MVDIRTGEDGGKKGKEGRDLLLSQVLRCI